MTVPLSLVRALTAVAVFMVLLGPSSATSAPLAAQPSRGALIDVPYLSQTPQLCGGAALAMVFRYWGTPGASAQDFADLVDESAGGIATSRLVAAAREHGWQSIAAAAPVQHPFDDLARHLGQGRPIVALIEDRPGVHHYVVIVGVTADAVVVHDPARAPYQVITQDDFDRRWQVSSRWMLLILPMESDATTPAATPLVLAADDAAASTNACDGLVAQGIEHARAGDQATAERVLRSAVALCPDSPASYRELAGLRLVQRRWLDSVSFAEQAAQRGANDTHTWQVLATSRFAAGDRLGALDAWNAIGAPTIDAIHVEGLRRTHQPTVTTLMGLTPGRILTASAFVRAMRRLEELPTSPATRLNYRPLDNGAASVTATVAEATRLPSGLAGWGAVVGRAVITDDIRVDMAALASQGDLWRPAFRWPRERRRFGLTLALPMPGVSGVLRVEGYRERQTYARPQLEISRSEEMRRRIGASYSNWLAAPLRIEVGAASDRLDNELYMALNGEATVRWGDFVATHVRLERWLPSANGRTNLTAADVMIDWRSTTDVDAPLWTARAGVAAVSEDAPLALWPGAGAFPDRTTLLRGRRLIRRHVLSGEVFGRQLSFATLERQHTVYRSQYGRVAIAGFADAAKARRRLDGAADSPLHVDIGAGLRIMRPGDDNQIRLDIGVGLRDGSFRASAGYIAGWGRRDR